MKPSTKDQVEGTLLTNAGQAEQLAGTVHTKIGRVEKVFEK